MIATWAISTLLMNDVTARWVAEGRNADGYLHVRRRQETMEAIKFTADVLQRWENRPTKRTLNRDLGGYGVDL
jgi:hypothetical protein